MILYFSASGNSEYVAKNIGYLNSDEVINLTNYLKKGEALDLTSEKPYLLVCPIYLSTIPCIVRNLLIKSSLKGNSNFYFIMTCAGSGESGASIDARKLCKALNMTYKGIEHLSMPQDYLMFFTVLNKDENDIKFNKAIANIENLSLRIKNEENFDLSKAKLIHKLTVKPVEKMFNSWFIKPKKFYTNNKCVSCGLCSKVCPLNNITLDNNKPVWGKQCIHCTACINKCPKGAIEYGKKTEGKNRYQAKKFTHN